MAQIGKNVAASSLCSPTTRIELKCVMRVGDIDMSRNEGVKRSVVVARDRGKNRKPLQRGRSLSTEAIQTIQALKRAYNKTHIESRFGYESESDVSRVFNSRFMRLLKLDMMAVLRELIRQNQCFLALKVFEEIRKENWYKPQLSLYTDMIAMMGSNGLWDQVQLLYTYLKSECNLGPDTQGFNQLLKTLIEFNQTSLVKDCYDLMEVVGSEPDRSTFKLLISGFESVGDLEASAVLRQDAQKLYGQDLEFLEENYDSDVTVT